MGAAHPSFGPRWRKMVVGAPSHGLTAGCCRGVVGDGKPGREVARMPLIQSLADFLRSAPLKLILSSGFSASTPMPGGGGAG